MKETPTITSRRRIVSPIDAHHQQSLCPPSGFDILIFDKNLLSLEVSIGKPLLYVKEILPQNVVLDTDGHAGDTSRHYTL